MKRVLLLLMLVVPMALSAQFKYKEIKDNDTYKRGAVPVVDGRAVVARSIEIPVERMAEALAVVDGLCGKGGTLTKVPAKYYEANRGDDVRVYQIEDQLVFNRNFINADVAMMSARMVVRVSQGKCVVTLDNILYRIGTTSSTTTGMPHEQWKSGYSVADTGSIVATAEEYISDEVALTRKGNLVRALAKYRVKTIDYVDAVLLAIQKQME